jgi:glycosyltransferase involved in cell wall biosynthesis
VLIEGLGGGAPSWSSMHSNYSKLILMHVIASVADEASGPSYSVPRLCEALGADGHCVRLLTVGARAGAEREGYRHDVFQQDWAKVPLLSRLCASRALEAALFSAGGEVEVLHGHGLWLMPNVYPARAARYASTPLIMSPRGMLGEAALKFSRPKKALFWAALQRSAVAAASCLHATSEQEYRDIRSFGLRQPVAIVPNGIDVPRSASAPKAMNGLRTVLYLGRLHPKKGVDQLINAWARLESKYPDWQLKIVGPSDSSYAGMLQRLIESSGLSRVHLVGALYGTDKIRAYEKAHLFVLPTFHENFAMTVAEALAFGTPVISTKGAPWAGLETHGCGWWIDHGVDSLASALNHAMKLDLDRLAKMGQSGRDWMRREFSWDSIAQAMVSVYGGLARCGEWPSCVITD